MSKKRSLIVTLNTDYYNWVLTNKYVQIVIQITISNYKWFSPFSGVFKQIKNYIPTTVQFISKMFGHVPMCVLGRYVNSKKFVWR